MNLTLPPEVMLATTVWSASAVPKVPLGVPATVSFEVAAVPEELPSAKPYDAKTVNAEALVLAVPALLLAAVRAVVGVVGSKVAVLVVEPTPTVAVFLTNTMKLIVLATLVFTFPTSALSVWPDCA